MISVFTGKSQNNLASAQENNHNFQSQTCFTQAKLEPVYFNYRFRKLNDSQKRTIQPLEFLHLCRSISDSAIQLQIARYDSFTKNKQRFGVVALGSGFASIALLGSAAASASSGGQANEIITGSFACLGIIGLLVIPISAISSSVPHQKRKAVLFRDLPIAYNQYVESHQ